MNGILRVYRYAFGLIVIAVVMIPSLILFLSPVFVPMVLGIEYSPWWLLVYTLLPVFWHVGYLYFLYASPVITKIEDWLDS